MHKMETIFKKCTNADLLYNGCTKLCVHIVKCTAQSAQQGRNLCKGGEGVITELAQLPGNAGMWSEDAQLPIIA